MINEYTGKIAENYYIGSTNIKINDAYYKNKTEEEINKSWFNFSKCIYEMARIIEDNKNKSNEFF